MAGRGGGAGRGAHLDLAADRAVPPRVPVNTDVLCRAAGSQLALMSMMRSMEVVTGGAERARALGGLLPLPWTASCP